MDAAASSAVTSASAAASFAGLRRLAGCGGCAAKAPPEMVEALGRIAAGIAGVDERVLVGLDPGDDAAVYALDAGRALVATVDFFPPLVDDPDDYGRIAAANALSDIYAMGGEPAFALALSGFPRDVPDEVVARVARAAASTLASCGARVLGGHSIRCAEPVFGLTVLGFVHPGRIWRKAGAQVGDDLWLSKALGTGILVSAQDPRYLPQAIVTMSATNRDAAQALRVQGAAVHAVTDISGYGLSGHLLEVARQSDVALEIVAADVPLLPGALPLAQVGVRTSAHRRAVVDVAAAAEFAVSVHAAQRALLDDPQTSGGLLVAAAADARAALATAGFSRIGRVSARGAALRFA